MENYKYLSQCKDFKLLLDHYSVEQLEDFERAIREYKESGNTEENYEYQAQHGYSDIINWYEGTMTTEQLFDFVEREEIMTLNQIIAAIHRIGCENEILLYLVNDRISRLQKSEYELKEKKKTIVVIRKINRQKNEAIHCLTEFN